jgi:6-phosphogluconolactonase (cycloisomerase 2 family)
LLVGSYSDGTTPGISVYDFDRQTGTASKVSEMKGILNPSYLTVSSDARHLYAVNETADGAVEAFVLNEDGSLQFLNKQYTRGADPCYINVNKQKTFVVTANYSGGSVSVFPLSKDGTLMPLSQYFDFNNSQSRVSHLHTVVFSPDEKYLFATDLGNDCIYRFRIEPFAENNFLIYEPQATHFLAKEMGPRHLSFHPGGKYLYCINERSGKISVMAYKQGQLADIQTIASDTTSTPDRKGSADIHCSPDGKYLYASNRLKNDGIAIFSVNEEDGRLTMIGYQTTGTHPRNFILSPDGHFLLCANRDSNTIQVFKRDSDTGLLYDTQQTIRVDKPVCLKFLLARLR